MRNPYHLRHCRSAAFSLFEIVVAMTILGIISTAVLSIVWQAGDTAAGIRELDRRDEEVSRFLTLLRESIENLPPGGTLSITPEGETASGYPELVIGDSTTAFTFGEFIGSSKETVISLRPGKPSSEGTPTYDLALSRVDFEPQDSDGSGMVFGAGSDDLLTPDEEGRYWLPLLSGVTAASWNFWDEAGSAWVDEWNDTEKMPVLLAFSFDDHYRPLPLRVVFEVPDQASKPPAADTNTTTTNTTAETFPARSSDGQGRPGGGGGGGGGGAKGGVGDGPGGGER